MRFRRDLISDLIEGQGAPSRGGRAVIVTAGVPGAGKSRAVDQLITRRGGHWLRIDPDDIKEALLRRAVADGEYDDLLRRELPDGRPVMPLELGGLVHAESVQIADDVLQQAMARGHDIVLEGTLRWSGVVDEYALAVERHGYEELTVVSVEVNRRVAIERALERWWSGRQDPAAELGGRFVPRAVISDCFESETAQRSVCYDHGAELVRVVAMRDGVNASLVTGNELLAAQRSASPIKRVEGED